MLFLGRYESLGVLGRGSMGEVHAARPTDDPATTVVVKMMRGDLADTPRARQQFEREISYSARLHHPYIVQVLDAGVDAVAGPCVVMAFVPGAGLDRVLRREHRLAPARVGRLLGCLCHALEAAHTAGVIHRDLKPANLMVVNAGGGDEFLTVMDFGLAALSTKPHLSEERLSGSEIVLAQGTPAYISPEQLRGDDIDGRADIYSTGVVLFEALTGRLPFAFDDVASLIDAHLKHIPPRFADVGMEDVPPAVEAIVRRCLAKYAPERPASVRDLAVAFGYALNVDVWAETAPAGWAAHDAKIPMADAVPPERDFGPNAFVRSAEAWMPDRIAAIKIGGFLADVGGVVVHSEPGLLQAQFRSPVGLLGKMFGRGSPDGIDLDIRLEKPLPTESRLVVTTIFRTADGRPPRAPAAWAARCEGIFDEMRKYLMAGGS